MNRYFTIIMPILFCIISLAAAAEKAPPEMKELAVSEIAGFGTDPVIVAAVKGQNGEGKSMEEILKMDEKWKSTPGVAPFMKERIESGCGTHLRDIQKKIPYYAEIFVMDNQGALVAATDKTSDYWQGDEAKFTESFLKGKGGIHISDIEFDESVQAYIVQISVPVTDSDKVIGAVTVGIDVDIMEQVKGKMSDR